MALNSYVKNFKFRIDLLGLNTAEKKLKNLEKDLNVLRDKRLKLDEEKAKLEKSAEKEKYDRAKKEYEEQRKLLDGLKAIKKSDRTEEQNKQIKELEASTKQYSEEAQKRNALYELYKTYGSSEKTKGYDELFEVLYRLEEISQDELELNQEALGIRGQQREAKKNQKSLKDLTKESFKNLTTGIKDKLKTSFNDFIKGFNEKLKDTFEKAIKDYKEVASYSLSTSLKMNQKAREQALMYGLSDAQNYALTKAMDEIGANTVEDLYWMTPAQQERFSERIGYWTGQYNSLADKDAFKTLEELQAELNDIKTDFQMEVVQFISNNKETKGVD